MDDFLNDDFVKQLQDEIIEDARKHYAEEVIDRWLNPRNFGELEHPQGHGKQTGSCGDVMEIGLRVINDVIEDARFMTEGCGPTLACGSMITEMAIGKTVEAAFKIDGRIVKDRLGGLPPEHEHCAQLAAGTLHDALRDYLVGKKTPWKKLYKRSG